jgi:alkanesulfonate monooxygenase SsuD/methylene tetrahydromethanopterin reductase-like flavin-dependent oxidoreductase (luciferase family)
VDRQSRRLRGADPRPPAPVRAARRLHVTPERYAAGLGQIARAAEGAGRTLAAFGTGHLLFVVIDDSYERAWEAATEHLSRRYASDFRAAAKKYAALGKPADVAERVAAFAAAGVRHVVVDPVGRYEERDAQLERFAREVRPLLGACA